LQGTGSGFLIEDCQLTYFGNAGGDNLDIEGNNGSLSNITIRRCVVNNAYGFNGGKCEGLYAYNVSGISVVQSTFDHNGWNSAYLYLGAEDIGYNHDMYFGPTCTGVDVEQNVIADASYAGVMARAGGTINYNLFLNDAVACSFGSADGVMSTVGGVSGSLIGNVVMGDRASQTIYYNTSAGAYMIGAGVAFGQGFVIANTAPSANVMCEYNVFTGDTQNAKPAITLTMATTTTNPAQAVGINNLTVAHNVIDGWRWGIQTDGRFVPGATGLYALNGLTISHNDFVNSNVDLVRHDGAFAASAESWSGDRYIDTLGPQPTTSGRRHCSRFPIRRQGAQSPPTTQLREARVPTRITSLNPFSCPSTIIARNTWPRQPSPTSMPVSTSLPRVEPSVGAAELEAPTPESSSARLSPRM
jgi:hypothetical protein